MALLRILKYGEKQLEIPAKKVEEINEDIKRITMDIVETMYAAPGIGLAATQVGIPFRIAAIDLSLGKNQDGLIILINPEIIHTEGNQQEEEGCLSFPGIYAVTNRPAKILVKAKNLNNEFYEIEGTELLARALSHEIDHLDGILFLERMNPITRRLIKKQIMNKIKRGEWE